MTTDELEAILAAEPQAETIALPVGVVRDLVTQRDTLRAELDKREHLQKIIDRGGEVEKLKAEVANLKKVERERWENSAKAFGMIRGTEITRSQLHDKQKGTK